MANSFMSELESLTTKKNELVEYQVSLADDLAKEIKVIQEEYAKKGQNVQNKIDEKNNQIDDMCEKIARYSWFGRYFVQILADLMTIFEGRQYVYQKAEYKKNKEYRYVDVIVLDSCLKQQYSDEEDETLDSLVDNGKMLLLEYSYLQTFPVEFCFYEFDSKNHSLVSKVKLDSFKYIEEFINRLIEWKINNYDNPISPDIIDELEIQFLRDKEETIRLNYNIRTNEERSAFETHCQERKEKLDKMLSLQNK